MKKLSNLLPRALIKGDDILGTKKVIDKFTTMDKIDKMFDKITVFESREMTRERFRQAVSELIVLPTDEQIEERINELPYIKHLDDGGFNDGQISGFEIGVYWFKEFMIKSFSNQKK